MLSNVEFPVYIVLGPWRIHPHFVFEALAYSVALRLTLWNSRRDSLPAAQRSSVVVGGMVGALVGAKVLVMLQHVYLAWENLPQYGLLLVQGKTVVGALLGAVMGVELTKKLIGVTRSTGDWFVGPLIAGMMIGRVGCFLTGLSDRTYGIATNLPWGVDFGDGIARHPTQLYEIVFLLGLLGLIWLQAKRRALKPGEKFQIFMVGYLSFRLLVDSIKPDFHPLLGLSAIQIACLLGLGYYWRTIRDFRF
ncbi:MAG: prolipoprotein diacylglyceryl transferase family protein [Cyanobacteria bacterium P01_A01_bin.114]